MTLENRIVFEIAMGIGNELDFTTMLKSSLSTYLRRLNCVSGIILESVTRDEGYRYESVFSIPRRSFDRLSGLPEIRRIMEISTEDGVEELLAGLPLQVSNGRNGLVFVFELEDYGILILEKNDGTLSNKLIQYLLPLNRKLSRACLLSRQSEIIRQKNEALENEIRQRKVAEEARCSIEHQVIQTQKLESLGVLAGGIAHDFNNLLMGILCNADIALMDVEETSEAASSVETIKNISKQAANLCDQILLYSGKATLKKEQIAPVEIVDGIRDLIRTSVSRKVEVKYHFDDGLPAISGDIFQLRQVVVNLLTNASEAIGESSGFINVFLSVKRLEEEDRESLILGDGFKPGSYCRLRVCDTGCGMDPVTRERIFEPFYTTKFSGRGLGLASVLGVVRSHNAFLKLDSTAGQGSCFDIFFPISEQTAAGRMEEKDAAPLPAGEKPIILVVDDEYIIASLVCRMLKKMGFEAWLEVSPLDAIERLRQEPAKCGIAILDMKMPEMDGGELFDALRKINPDLTGILSSGYYETDLDETFRNRGFSAFLHKPYEIKELQKILAELLDKD